LLQENPPILNWGVCMCVFDNDEKNQ